MRILYGTPEFVQWLRTLIQPGDADTERLGEATAAEQVDDLFYTFLSGRPLIRLRQFRVVREEINPVWELKTPDIRIFGWFAMKDCFIAAFGNWANNVKDHDLYRGYRIAIRRFRRELGLVDGLCVEGTAPSDVLSV